MILVVEDEQVVANVACRMLKVVGHETHHVATGGEALDELAKGGYDAVLLDMTLPDGRSQDVIAAVPESVKLVIMSGHTKEELDLGELPFLAKPFQLPDLERLFPCAS
ncbi:MAG: response regulator [Planctomycetota bacterium]